MSSQPAPLYLSGELRKKRMEREEKMENEKRTQPENNPSHVIEEVTLNETGTEKIKGGMPGAVKPGYERAKQIKI